MHGVDVAADLVNGFRFVHVVRKIINFQKLHGVGREELRVLPVQRVDLLDSVLRQLSRFVEYFAVHLEMSLLDFLGGRHALQRLRVRQVDVQELRISRQETLLSLTHLLLRSGVTGLRAERRTSLFL